MGVPAAGASAAGTVAASAASAPGYATTTTVRRQRQRLWLPLPLAQFACWLRLVSLPRLVQLLARQSLATTPPRLLVLLLPPAHAQMRSASQQGGATWGPGLLGADGEEFTALLSRAAAVATACMWSIHVSIDGCSEQNDGVAAIYF